MESQMTLQERKYEIVNIKHVIGAPDVRKYILQ